MQWAGFEDQAESSDVGTRTIRSCCQTSECLSSGVLSYTFSFRTNWIKFQNLECFRGLEIQFSVGHHTTTLFRFLIERSILLIVNTPGKNRVNLLADIKVFQMKYMIFCSGDTTMFGIRPRQGLDSWLIVPFSQW